ncbi:uncharacterized protein LOC110914338 [Helianthus annuus]|uniref:uncharacterized protein LOC110914338 n=1 Tax=Helianthus annuus TaxID=4232 RepID=UPI000B8FD2C6|nr:uncharacterized protein LOC110914338 [Helianthus annuus]
MADSSEAHNHPVDQNDDARLNVTGAELQAMIDIAVNNVVDRVLKDHKRKCDNTPNKGCKKGKTSSSYNQSKPDKAKPKCKTCKKKHFGKCFYEQTRGCVICKEMDHKTHECKNLKDNQQTGEKTRCKTCRNYHFGSCIFGSQPLTCGICKSKEHKTLECQDIKDATCYGCNEKGHVKTNCPNETKKSGKAMKTKAGSSQMNAQEAIQDDNVTTDFAAKFKRIKNGGVNSPDE